MICIKLNLCELDYGVALHTLENGIFLHVLKELFAEILNPRTCGHLDAHVYSWNNYPGQHYLRGNHINGFP